MSIYWRAQPKGQSLFGHQSRLAYDRVQGIFAFEDPRKIFDTVTWLHVRKRLDAYEMVEFKGRMIEQPEDSEGVVVAPERELSRVPMRDWVESVDGAPAYAGELEAADSGGHALGANVARQSVASAYGSDQVAKVSGSGSLYHVTLKNGKALQVKVDGSTGTVIDPSDGHTVATHTVSEAEAAECGCRHAHPPSVPVAPCDEAPQPVALAIAGAGEGAAPKLSWTRDKGQWIAKGKRGTYRVHRMVGRSYVWLGRDWLNTGGHPWTPGDGAAIFSNNEEAKRFAERADTLVRKTEIAERVEAVGERVEAVGEVVPLPAGGPIQIKSSRADDFYSAFESAFRGSPFTHHVTHYRLVDLAKMTCFMTIDGLAGVAVKKHGDGRIEATALYNHGAVKGSGLYLLAHSIEHAGVNYVECYGPVLNQLYAKLGFKDVEKSAFKAEYAAAGWDTARFDHPDYHVMRLA